MGERLTVLIPCKDERKNIRLCIESVRAVADEILLADSGSTDGTLEIVRQMGGCRIIEREYINHGDFLDWAVPQAKNRWVLVVDADERLTESLAREIKQVLARPSEGIDAYWVSFRCFFMGRPVRFSRWNTPALRLVHRDRCRNRQCRVHPEFLVPRERTGKLSGKLLHYSFWTYNEYFRKYEKYTQWVAEDRWDRGKRTGVFGLLVRPILRFFHMYFLRLGFLDGLPGIQICALMAFYNTFVKQGRLWEMEHALKQPDPEAEQICSLSEWRGEAGDTPQEDGSRKLRRA